MLRVEQVASFLYDLVHGVIEARHLPNEHVHAGLLKDQQL